MHQNIASISDPHRLGEVLFGHEHREAEAELQFVDAVSALNRMLELGRLEYVRLP